MSVEQAKAFIERMKTDEAFRAKVMAIEDAEGRMACINSEGYDCTAEMIKEQLEWHKLGDYAGLAGGGVYPSSPKWRDIESDA